MYLLIPNLCNLFCGTWFVTWLLGDNECAMITLPLLSSTSPPPFPTQLSPWMIVKHFGDNESCQHLWAATSAVPTSSYPCQHPQRVSLHSEQLYASVQSAETFISRPSRAPSMITWSLRAALLWLCIAHSAVAHASKMKYIMYLTGYYRPIQVPQRVLSPSDNTMLYQPQSSFQT